jgi:hypothetical protein
MSLYIYIFFESGKGHEITTYNTERSNIALRCIRCLFFNKKFEKKICSIFFKNLKKTFKDTE